MVADILLVEVSSQKRPTHAAGDGPDRATGNGVTDHSTTDAARNCPHRAVAAAATMARAAVDVVMTRHCCVRHYNRCREQPCHDGSFQSATH